MGVWVKASEAVGVLGSRFGDSSGFRPSVLDKAFFPGLGKEEGGRSDTVFLQRSCPDTCSIPQPWLIRTMAGTCVVGTWESSWPQT